jgi:hypothetical protein
MRRLFVRTSLVGGIAVVLTLWPIVVSDAARVGPSQRFIGNVNGDHTSAVVLTFCPGPEWPGRTGPPVGNQFLATILVRSGVGFTGSASTAIVATFAEDRSKSVTLRRYGVARAVPVGLALPCSGSGSVVFTPTPSTAAGGAVPDTVKVTYENIAV